MWSYQGLLASLIDFIYCWSGYLNTRALFHNQQKIPINCTTPCFILFTEKGWIRLCLKTTHAASACGLLSMSQGHVRSLPSSPSATSWLPTVAHLVLELVRLQHTLQSALKRTTSPNTTSQLSSSNPGLMTTKLIQFW